MRITEAAQRLGTSPRMLRYRETLGLLPRAPWRAGGAGGPHRQFRDQDVAAVALALELERRLDISPAALAFGLRVLAEPAVRAQVAELGRRIGRVPRRRAARWSSRRSGRCGCSAWAGGQAPPAATGPPR